MPAAVVAGERVHLVHHDRPQPGEQRPVLDLEADQHGFQRLRRGQQHVRRIAQQPLPRRRAHVAVPDRGPAAQPAGVGLQPGQQVVQQRLQRADVDDRQAGPAPRVHGGQQREHRGLGLAARRGREQQRVGAVQDRPGRLLLQRAQRRPAQRVDDVMHHDRVQPVQPGAHRRPLTAGQGRCRRRGPPAARPRRCAPPRTARPPRGSARSGGAGRSRRTGRPGPGHR